MKPAGSIAATLARGSDGAFALWRVVSDAPARLAALAADPADDRLCAPPDAGGLIQPMAEARTLADILVRLAADAADDIPCAPHDSEGLIEPTAGGLIEPTAGGLIEPTAGGLIEPMAEGRTPADFVPNLAAAPVDASARAPATPPRAPLLPPEPGPSRARATAAQIGRFDGRHDAADTAAGAPGGGAAETSAGRGAGNAPGAQPPQPAALAAAAAGRRVMLAGDPARRAAVERILAGQPAVAAAPGAVDVLGQAAAPAIDQTAAPALADQTAVPALADAAARLDRALARIVGASRSAGGGPRDGREARERPTGLRGHPTARADAARHAAASPSASGVNAPPPTGAGVSPVPQWAGTGVNTGVDTSTGVRRLLARAGAAVSAEAPALPRHSQGGASAAPGAAANGAAAPSALLPEHAPRRDPRAWRDDPPPAAEADPETLLRALTDLVRREARRSGIDVGSGA